MGTTQAAPAVQALGTQALTVHNQVSKGLRRAQRSLTLRMS